MSMSAYTMRRGTSREITTVGTDAVHIERKWYGTVVLEHVASVASVTLY